MNKQFAALMAVLLLVSSIPISGYTFNETAASGDVSEEALNEEEEAAEKIKEFRNRRAAHVAASGAKVEPYYEESAEEKKIISFVQVPDTFYDNHSWTGEWADIAAGGQRLSSFGCGICCLSNIISTFSRGTVTPDKIYHLARKNVRYNPDSGTGAIDWNQMAGILDMYHYEYEIGKKPSLYTDFQRKAASSDAMVVLVCKDNDDSLWWYTNGHYVTVWEYDRATDTVFVTDSSGLYNRARVKLSYVYDALKTSSFAQYMTVSKK